MREGRFCQREDKLPTKHYKYRKRLLGLWDLSYMEALESVGSAGTRMYDTL